MEDKATLRELRERYYIDQRWMDVAGVLEREIPLTEDREERLELYEELGTVYVEHLENAEGAYEAFVVVADLRVGWTDEQTLEVFEQILAFEPDYFPAFERVEAVLRRRGDVASFESLAGRYIDLAAGAVNEPEAFLRHQREAARIFERELASPESALVVLLTSLTAQTWPTGILEDVERLMHSTGNWDEPIERLIEVVGNMTDSSRSGRLHKRIGFWCLQAGRSSDAMFHLRETLRHFPADREALEALERLYRVEGRWDDILTTARAQRATAADAGQARELRDRLVKLLHEAASAADVDADRARYLAELGHLHDIEFQDRSAAVGFWEQALNAEPATIDAARPLIDHYLERNRWERAAPVLEVVMKLAQQKRGLLSDAEHHQRWMQYADVLDRIGNEKLALHAYRQAYELDRNDPKTLERLGLLLYEDDEFDQAYHIFVQLADRHERSVDPAVLIEVLRKAAAIKAHHKDSRTAMGLLDRALRLDPDNRDTLKLAADIAASTGDMDASMKARRRLVDSEANPTIKFKDLVEMGNLWADKGDWEQAARAYVNALEVDADSMSVLRKLLEAFQKLSRWREAIGVLERLAAHETDRIKRGKLFYTMGIIARDEIGSPERAVSHFEQALEEDMELLKAFEAIDRILTDHKSWKELERAYRRMLHRVSENELGLDEEAGKRLELMLWTNLGEVYRSRLGDLKAAVQAFETVLAMKPDNEKTQLILADLYERAGIHTGGAVDQHRKLLKKDPLRAESLHAIFRSYMAAKRYDPAHCVAGALHAINRGDEETTDYYRTYVGRHLKLAKGTFYPELLDKVYPRAQNRVVNGVMAHLAVALRAYFAHNIKDFGVDARSDRIDEANSEIMFVQMYRYITKAISLQPPPHLYARRDHPLGMRILNVEPPALLLGSDVLGGFDDDREMAFRAAKLIAWMRPEHYLASTGNSPDQLRVMFVSAMDWAQGRKPTAGRDGAAIIKALKSAPSQSQMQIQTLVHLYLKHASAPPDMTEWVTQAEHATSRFGLIFCNEFEKAVHCIKSEPPVLTTASVEERIVDLVKYATSEEYFEVRKELGLAIN